MKKTIKEYENKCNEIAKIFAKKQDVDFDGWVGYDIGSTACFNENYFFNFSDILLDLKTSQKKGFILEWHSYFIENKHKSHVNFKSYSLGFRYK